MSDIMWNVNLCTQWLKSSCINNASIFLVSLSVVAICIDLKCIVQYILTKSILIFKCTSAEHYIDISNKESFFEYSGRDQTYHKLFGLLWIWSLYRIWSPQILVLSWLFIPQLNFKTQCGLLYHNNFKLPKFIWCHLLIIICIFFLNFNIYAIFYLHYISFVFNIILRMYVLIIFLLVKW